MNTRKSLRDSSPRPPLSHALTDKERERIVEKAKENAAKKKARP